MFFHIVCLAVRMGHREGELELGRSGRLDFGSSALSFLLFLFLMLFLCVVAGDTERRNSPCFRLAQVPFRTAWEVCSSRGTNITSRPGD